MHGANGSALSAQPPRLLGPAQIRGLAAELGVRAAFLNSTQSFDEMLAVERALRRGELDLLYVAPERLMLDNWKDNLAAWNVTALAIDEVVNEGLVDAVDRDAVRKGAKGKAPFSSSARRSRFSAFTCPRPNDRTPGVSMIQPSP